MRRLVLNCRCRDAPVVGLTGDGKRYCRGCGRWIWFFPRIPNSAK